MDVGIYQTAAFSKRIAAGLLDILLFLVVWTTLYFLLGTSFEVEIVVFLLGGPVLFLLLNSLFESSSLQATVGKLVLKEKVMDQNGNRLSLLRALQRNILITSYVLIPPLYLLLLVFVTPRHYSLHDFLSKTSVVDSGI
jgi:uncharacterized RDD family membrane protein YckC